MRPLRRIRGHLRRRRWTLVAAATLAVVALLVYFRWPQPDLRSGSEEIDEASVRIGARTLREYRIVYRTEIRSGDEWTRSTDDVRVRRPFEANVVARAGRSELNDITNSFTRYAVGEQVFAVQPGAPEPDRRPDAVIGDAVRDGYAQAREHRRVAGRECRVYRMSDGSDAGSLAPVADDEDPVDVCVDQAGLILEEASFDGDELQRRRIATEIEEDPELDDDLFDLDAPSGDAKQVGSVKALEDSSRLPGDAFWEFGKDPKGFEFRGRFAVVPPGQPGFTDPQARGSILAFMSEVWTDGADLLVVDQGATQSSKPFEDDPNSRAVRAGELGDGELRYSMRESEVRFLTGGSSFVRLRGTLAPSRLLAFARSLEKLEGGPLRVKD